MSNQVIDDVRSTLRAPTRSQYESNSGISLPELRDRGASGYRILPALPAYCASAARKQITTISRDEPSTGGHGIMALLIPTTDAFVYRNNQFLTVFDARRTGLTALSGTAWPAWPGSLTELTTRT